MWHNTFLIRPPMDPGIGRSVRESRSSGNSAAAKDFSTARATEHITLHLATILSEAGQLIATGTSRGDTVYVGLTAGRCSYRAESRELTGRGPVTRVQHHPADHHRAGTGVADTS